MVSKLSMNTWTSLSAYAIVKSSFSTPVTFMFELSLASFWLSNTPVFEPVSVSVT